MLKSNVSLVIFFLNEEILKTVAKINILKRKLFLIYQMKIHPAVKIHFLNKTIYYFPLPIYDRKSIVLGSRF